MRTVSQDDLARNWRNVASEAERAPVRVHVDGLPDMVILSEAEFEKFRRHIGERLIRLGSEGLSGLRGELASGENSSKD